MTTMKFSAPKALPPGAYPAALLNLGEGEGKFGPFLDWTFELDDADGEATQVSRRTSTKTGPGSIARVLVEALLGRDVQLDEEVDLDGLMGRRAVLEIETNANGYDHIVNAMPGGPGGTGVSVDDIAF